MASNNAHELTSNDQASQAVSQSQATGGGIAEKPTSVEEASYSNLGDRYLRSRHLVTLALDCVIGTGILVNVGTTLRDAGPVGTTLSYAFIGILAKWTMSAMCEMVIHFPSPAPLSRLGARFVHPAFGFMAGFTYWVSYCLFYLTASVTVVVAVRKETSHEDFPLWQGLLVALGPVIVNMFPLPVYAEVSFTLAILKTLCVVYVIVLGLIYNVGLIPHHRALGLEGLRVYGAFAQYHGVSGAAGNFLGVLSALSQASYSYYGLELTYVAAGDTAKPEKFLPEAQNILFRWVVWIYLLAVVVTGSVAPWLTSTSVSPFAAIARDLDKPWLAYSITTTILFCTISVAVASLYAASRALRALLLPDDLGSDPRPESMIPRCLWSVRKSSRQWEKSPPIKYLNLTRICVLVSALPTVLVLASDASGSPTKLKRRSGSLASMAGLIAWISILITYISFRRVIRNRQDDVHTFDRLYHAQWQPFTTIASIIVFTIVLALSGLPQIVDHVRDGSALIGDFLSSYLSVGIAFLSFLLSYIYYAVYNPLHSSRRALEGEYSPDLEDHAPFQEGWADRLFRHLTRWL